MRKPLMVLGLLLAVTASMTASADNRRLNGALCNPFTSTDAGRLNYSPFGVHNVSSSSAKVSCGGVSLVGSDMTVLEFVAYDRNPTADVVCVGRVQDSAGNQIWSSTRQTVSSGAGHQTITFPTPSNTVGMVHLECTIPPASDGNFSHLASYRISTNP